MYEIDHVLIFTCAGAPEADRLIVFGLSEGSPNRHPGQGTANRSFRRVHHAFNNDIRDRRCSLWKREWLVQLLGDSEYMC